MKRNPLQFNRPYHVNYLEGFYLNLVSDIIKSGSRLFKGRLLCFKKWLKKKDHTLTIRIRWVLAALLLLALWPHPTHTVYGDPISPAPQTHKVALVKQLPETSLAPVAALEPVAVPEPAPAPQPILQASGCVSYFSGDYYLDNIIRYESGGNSCATNPGDCFGLLQACPGAPLRAACGGNPSCQIAWFQQYKTGGRSWAQVWQHELDYGWW